MDVKRYRNSKGARYLRVKETTTEKINVHTPKTENQKTMEESKKQTEIKNEIFDLIDNYIYSGKSTLELIEKLNFEERFNKYGTFFAGWIEDRKSKYQMVMKAIEYERNLGKSNEEIFEKIASNHKYRVQRKSIKELLLKEKNNSEKGIEH